MNNDLIFLGDLTHVTPMGYGTEMTPYPIACIKSWLLQYSEHASNLQVRVFKHPQKFIDAFLKERPAIVGLSNYMWNLDLCYTIAKEIKGVSPETFIIFGGPNYPLEDHVREQWLNAHPAVDAYIIGEGEEPFTKLVDAWRESGDPEEAKRSGVDGCHAIIDGKFFKSSNVSPRVTEINRIPSPYLMGYLDEFLGEMALTPLLESNRGCPFTCTFCADGIAEKSKVYWKSAERFEQELRYIAQRYQGKVLDMADDNFGMYQQDLEIASAIARVKEEYGYPYYLHAATGKNHKTRVLDCAEILKGSLRLAASVQSLDPEVLTNVKRKNISADELIRVAKSSNATEANTYSEVILGLPGDTKEKHMKTVLLLADADIKLISLYTLMVLEGSELTTSVSMAKWKLGTRYRIVPRCFGIYNFDGKELLSAEPEAVAVESSTLSFEDYLECREFALTMGLFYQDRVLYEMYRFLRNFGIRTSDVLPILHERRMAFSSGITDLYRSYNRETREELWEDKEDLERFAKSDRSVIQKYMAGELGNNVLYRHRAIALLRLVDEIHEAAFGVAAELLEQKDIEAYHIYAPYLAELKLYSSLRKRNVFAYDDQYSHLFWYNLDSLSRKDFEGLPMRLDAPIAVEFSHTDEQKEMLRNQFDQYGTELNAIGRIVSRIAMSKLQRAVAFSGASTGKEVYSYTPGFKLSPSEFA